MRSAARAAGRPLAAWRLLMPAHGLGAPARHDAAGLEGGFSEGMSDRVVGGHAVLGVVAAARMPGAPATVATPCAAVATAIIGSLRIVVRLGNGRHRHAPRRARGDRRRPRAGRTPGGAPHAAAAPYPAAASAKRRSAPSIRSSASTSTSSPRSDRARAGGCQATQARPSASS